MYRDQWLMHHGVKGMKWGVRRYQDYGHGGYIPKGESGQFKNSSVQTKLKTNSKTRYSGLPSKKKVVKTAAVVAGVAALTLGTVYAARTGTLKNGANFVKTKAKNIGSSGKNLVGRVRSKIKNVAFRRRANVTTGASAINGMTSVNARKSGRALMDARPNRSVASIDKQIKIGMGTRTGQNYMPTYTTASTNTRRIRELGKAGKLKSVSKYVK